TNLLSAILSFVLNIPESMIINKQNVKIQSSLRGGSSGFMILFKKSVILKQDIYNMDETGFQMGMISTAKVISGSETQESHVKAIQPGNREWVTAIVAVNAAGWALPLHIILAAENH
ncbi:hypothetical protein T310_10020, partial [Rasamsonia emersonii CBS 393.64]